MPTQQPLRSDGFHYTHQHRDQEFEDGLRNLMNPIAPVSEGALRESQGADSRSLTNLQMVAVNLCVGCKTSRSKPETPSKGVPTPRARRLRLIYHHHDLGKRATRRPYLRRANKFSIRNSASSVGSTCWSAEFDLFSLI